jgi:hypothetical protein
VRTLVALLLLSAASAHAQQAWRCERSGTVTYQAQPCDNGRAVDVADTRSAEQVRAAQAATKRSEKHSAAMASDHRALERRAKPKAARIGPKTQTLQADKAPKKRPKVITRRVPKPPAAGLAS